MLFITKLTDGGAGGGNARAYALYQFSRLREVEQEQGKEGLAGYYVTGDEADTAGRSGRWIGSGLAAFGEDENGEPLVKPADKISAEQFLHLMEGKNPLTGEALQPGRTTPGNAGRVVGYDIGVSADKSVSILWATGDEETRRKIEEAFDASVDAAVEYLEEHACRVRKGAGGVHQARGEGLVIGVFHHTTARPTQEGVPGDPHLHAHLVVANITRGPDGKLQALHSPELFAHYRTAGAIQEAVLRQRLREELGIEWTPVDEKGLSKVVGVPEDLRQHFSSRRHEIVSEAYAHGADLDDPDSMRVASLATRKEKEGGYTEAELLEHYQEEIRALGYEPNQLLENARLEAQKLREREAEESFLVGMAAAAAGESVLQKGTDVWLARRLSAHQASFTRRDVMRAIAEHAEAFGVSTTQEIEARADAFLVSEHAVSLTGLEDYRDAIYERFEALTGDAEKAEKLTAKLIGREEQPEGPFTVPTDQEPRYTTPLNLKAERRVMDAVFAKDPNLRTASEADVETVLDWRERAGQKLGEDQEQMVRAATTGDDVFVPIQGQAGAGKGFALAVCNDAWRRAGLIPIGCSTAAVAAKRLEEDTGIPSTTIASLLTKLEEGGAQFNRNHVLVIDEIGMVSNMDLARLITHARRAGVRIVGVGDYMQLSAVQAGGIWAAINAQAPEKIVALTENRRQKLRWERFALATIREAAQLDDAAIETVVKLYDEHGAIKTAGTEEEALKRMVDEYFEHRAEGKSALMMALHRSSVEKLNQLATEKALELGLLGDEVEIAGRTWRVGEQIMALSNARQYDVLNGTVGRVVAVEQRPVEWDVVGRLVPTDGETEPRTVQWTTAKQPPEVGEIIERGSNRAGQPPVEVLDVEARQHETFLIIETDDGEVAVPEKYVAEGNITTAWGSTVHKAQGATVDVSLTYARGFHRNLLYTALSRGREGNDLFFITGERDEHNPDHVGCSAACVAADRAYPTPQEEFAQILRRDGVEEAALETARQRVETDTEWVAMEEERRELAKIIATAPPTVDTLRAEAKRRYEEAEAAGDLAEANRWALRVRQLTPREPEREGEQGYIPVEQQQYDQWVEEHREQIERWEELTMKLSASAGLAHRWLPDYMPEPPEDPLERGVWQRQVALIESYRERWGVPEEQLTKENPWGPEPADDEQRMEWITLQTAWRSVETEPQLEIEADVTPEVAPAPELELRMELTPPDERQRPAA